MWNRDDTGALNAIATASVHTKNKLEAILLQYSEALDSKIQSVERAYGQQNLDMDALREEAEEQGDSVVPYRLAALEVQKMFDMLRSDDGELSTEFKTRSKRHMALVAHQEDLQKISSGLGMRRRRAAQQEVSFLTEEELDHCLVQERRRFDVGQQEGAAVLWCVWEKVRGEAQAAVQRVLAEEERRSGICLCEACISATRERLDVMLQSGFEHKRSEIQRVCAALGGRGKGRGGGLGQHEVVPPHHAERLAAALEEDLVSRLDEAELAEMLHGLRDEVTLLELYRSEAAPPNQASHSCTTNADSSSFIGLNALDAQAWSTRDKVRNAASTRPQPEPRARSSPVEGEGEEVPPRLLVDNVTLLAQLFEVYHSSLSAQRAISAALGLRSYLSQAAAQLRMLRLLGGGT